MMFTTETRDNDLHQTLNCAVAFEAPWWYKSCHQALLTGHYGENVAPNKGIKWVQPFGNGIFAKKAIMMIRPLN